MNKKMFNIWTKAIDTTYLEEAAIPQKKKLPNAVKILVPLTAAACLMLFIGTAALNNSFSGSSEPPASFAEHNYTLPVPEEARSIAYEMITEQETPMAKAVFTVDNSDYTLCALHTEQAQDISGMTAEGEPLVWYIGGLELQLCSTNDLAWVSWFDSREGTQWCLTGETSSLSLLTTASSIVEQLGYNVAVAPGDATDITFNAFLLKDMTVAETSFLQEGIRYSYRMAATSGFDILDISGMEESFEYHLTAEVGWCPAELYYNENGAGKILWLDVVPGLLYSLSMESNATEEALLNAALTLFEPAQDNANWK